MNTQHPTDSIIQINWTRAEDLTNLTAGPVAPGASTVSIPAAQGDASLPNIGKENQSKLLQGDQAHRTERVNQVSGSIVGQHSDVQLQQLNIIHDALSATGLIDGEAASQPLQVGSVQTVTGNMPHMQNPINQNVKIEQIMVSPNTTTPYPQDPSVILPISETSSADFHNTSSQQSNLREVSEPVGGNMANTDSTAHEVLYPVGLPPENQKDAGKHIIINENTEYVVHEVTVIASPSQCSACGKSIIEGVPLPDTNVLDDNIYQCHVCGQRTITDADKVRVDQEKYQCNVCHKEFDMEDEHRAHESQAHVDYGSYNCGYCSGVFTAKFERDMHETCTHAKGSIFRCKLCFKKFATKKRWIKHTAKCRKKRNGKDFKAMVNQNLQSTSNNQDVMKQTEKMTYSSSDIVEGMDLSNMITTEQGEKLWICGQCGKEFKHYRYFHKHVKDVCGVTVYKCDGCEEEFPTKRKLSAHEIQFKDQAHYKCSCGREYQAKQSYRAHKRSHEEDKPYKCRYCGKGFLAINKCKIHERSHTGEKPFSCKVCGKEYVMKESLTIHERKHKNDFRFFCKYCQKGFVKKYTYRMHELNHEGYKPFSCKFCKKTFFRKSDLARHELCSHNHGKDAYRFLCSHCGRGFKLKGDLKVHERIHTGEKPHYCTYCKRGFGRTSYYNRHMRLYHETQKIKEEIQDKDIVIADCNIAPMEDNLMTVATCEDSC